MFPGIFNPHFGAILGPKTSVFGEIFGFIFWIDFWILFGLLLGTFWGPFWDQIGPRRGQDEPKRAIESFKYPKTYICKDLKKLYVFLGFWGPEASQESLGRPKTAPKRHPRNSKASTKRDPNMNPKMINFLTNFGTILGTILGSKSSQKGVPKLDHFWNPLPPHKRGPGEAILRIKREWWNCYSYWNYNRQKKGRDKHEHTKK